MLINNQDISELIEFGFLLVEINIKDISVLINIQDISTLINIQDISTLINIQDISTLIEFGVLFVEINIQDISVDRSWSYISGNKYPKRISINITLYFSTLILLCISQR